MVFMFLPTGLIPLI